MYQDLICDKGLAFKSLHCVQLMIRYLVSVFLVIKAISYQTVTVQCLLVQQTVKQFGTGPAFNVSKVSIFL